MNKEETEKYEKAMMRIEKLREIAEEIRQYYYNRGEERYEEGVRDGREESRIPTKLGYEVKTIREGVRELSKEIEIKIDKTITEANMIVKLPKELAMKLKVRVIFRIKEDNRLTNTYTTKTDGEDIRLFHTNMEDTCWGGISHPRQINTAEELEELEKKFKELMETINWRSTYNLGDELLPTKKYLKAKYLKESDDAWLDESETDHEATEEELEEFLKKAIEANPYVEK